MVIKYDFELISNFEYEITAEELQMAVIDICLSKANKKANEQNYDLLQTVINELDIIYNEDIMQKFEEEIKEFFYEDAYLEYQNQIGDCEDRETWYGTKNDIVGV